MEIECDLEKDGSLDELEVTAFKDSKCKDKDGKKIDVKPGKCGKNPWIDGKYIKLTFRPPPTFAEMMVLFAVCFCFIGCICCIACSGSKGSKASSLSYSEQHDEDDSHHS